MVEAILDWAGLLTQDLGTLLMFSDSRVGGIDLRVKISLRNIKTARRRMGAPTLCERYSSCGMTNREVVRTCFMQLRLWLVVGASCLVARLARTDSLRGELEHLGLSSVVSTPGPLYNTLYTPSMFPLIASMHPQPMCLQSNGNKLA